MKTTPKQKEKVDSITFELVSKCNECPAMRTPRTRGEFYKGKWFCSHICIETYKADMRDLDD
jgi:hypothetical protein